MTEFPPFSDFSGIPEPFESDPFASASDPSGLGRDAGGGTAGPLVNAHGDPVLCGLEEFSPAERGSLGFRIPLNSEVLDLGAPEADMDGDGFMEAMTLQDERGLTVYTDVDGDRAIDQVSTVRFDGTYDTWQLTNAKERTAFGGFANGDPRLNEWLPRWECTDFGQI